MILFNGTQIKNELITQFNLDVNDDYLEENGDSGIYIYIILYIYAMNILYIFLYENYSKWKKNNEKCMRRKTKL